MQIVCKGPKDLGDTRPLGSKLLELSAELLVVPLQRCNQGFELLLASGRLCQPVHQALRILEPPSDFCAEARGQGESARSVGLTALVGQRRRRLATAM